MIVQIQERMNLIHINIIAFLLYVNDLKILTYIIAGIYTERNTLSVLFPIKYVN